MEENEMPVQGFYLALVILGFVLGIIWGVVSIFPYRNMKAAINSGDVELAQINAKTIKSYVFIGFVMNVLVFIASLPRIS